MSLTLTRRHNVDRFGYLIPHRYGNVPMVGAVATYRPGEGRFGGAVAVEEGTENLAYNPTFSGAIGGNAPSGYLLATQDTVPDIAKLVQSPWGTQGVLAYHVKVNNARAYLYLYSSHSRHIEAAEGDIFTISFYATSNDVQVWYRILDDNLSTVRAVTNPSFTNTNGDQYVHVTDPLPAGARYFYVERIGIGVNAIRTGEAIFERLQVEKKPFATSFVDGTRAAGKLSYNLSLTNPHTGHLWMYAPYRIESVDLGGAAKDNSPLFELIDEATGDYLGFKTYRNWPYINPKIGTYTSNRHKEWIPEAHTWYGVTWKLLPDNFIVEVRDVSGNLIRTWDAPSSEFANFHPTQLRLGVFGGAVLVDELLILPYAASEEEIASWYEAQGLLPPHPQALLQWDWQAVRPATMVKL